MPCGGICGRPIAPGGGLCCCCCWGGNPCPCGGGGGCCAIATCGVRACGVRCDGFEIESCAGRSEEDRIHDLDLTRALVMLLGLLLLLLWASRGRCAVCCAARRPLVSFSGRRVARRRADARAGRARRGLIWLAGNRATATERKQPKRVQFAFAPLGRPAPIRRLQLHPRVCARAP